jgi:hypothetical protein
MLCRCLGSRTRAITHPLQAWSGLEAAETAKGEFLRAYVARQEELAVLAKRFAGDAADLEQVCIMMCVRACVRACVCVTDV